MDADADDDDVMLDEELKERASGEQVYITGDTNSRGWSVAGEGEVAAQCMCECVCANNANGEAAAGW